MRIPQICLIRKTCSPRKRNFLETKTLSHLGSYICVLKTSNVVNQPTLSITLSIFFFSLFFHRQKKRQQSSFSMATDEESALSTSTLEELSAGLAAAAAANAERLLPSGADKEMKKLSESVQQIAPLLKDAKAKKMKELEDTVSDIISILQLFLPKGAIDHVILNPS